MTIVRHVIFAYICDMAKTAKKAPEKKKRGNYDKPLQTNGSFMDLIGAVVKDAQSKDKKKP